MCRRNEPNLTAVTLSQIIPGVPLGRYREPVSTSTRPVPENAATGLIYKVKDIMKKSTVIETTAAAFGMAGALLAGA